MTNTTVHTTVAVLQPDTLVQQAKSGANWFFWIAGMSIFNSFVHLLGGSLNFVIGLGATQVIDALTTMMSQENGDSFFLGIGLVLDLIVVGLFVLFGVFAQRLHRWALVVGISATFWIVSSFYGCKIGSAWRFMHSYSTVYGVAGLPLTNCGHYIEMHNHIWLSNRHLYFIATSTKGLQKTVYRLVGKAANSTALSRPKTRGL